MLEFKKVLHILDFDIENRPLSYWYEGKPTAEITAIAACWFNDLNSMRVGLLGRNTLEEILLDFIDLYNQADMVTGHNIRKHDLPMINGAMMELGLGKLDPKLTCDTLADMYKKGDIPASQEYLLDLLGLGPKVHMTQHAWRDANRLTETGLRATESRVTGDVVDHVHLRKRMLELNLLKGPKIWKP